jgi:small subunit ribosomal protein S17
MNKKNNSPKNSSTDKEKRKNRLFKGRVISDKMDKTIVVLVSRLKKHPRYQTRYTVDRKV